MNPIESIFHAHSGRVFLLGNGPSLNNYDLSKLNPNEVISMNRSWRCVKQPLYHCVSGDLRINFNPFPQNIIFLGQPEQYRGYKTKCPVILVQTRIAGVKIPEPKVWLSVPSEIDLRRGWPSTHTPPTHVGLFAVYAAWWIGFRKVYLLGFDGYGRHFMESNVDRKLTKVMFEVKHKMMVPQFRKYIDILLKNAPDLKVFNCNPRNEYKNLPVADFNELI